MVLIAESDALLAMDLSDSLGRAGYRVLGPAITVSEALRLFVEEKPTVAVIDVALRDGSCADLAHALRRLDVPFLVHSGWQQNQLLGSDFQGAPWLTRPALPADIVICVNELVASVPASTAAVRQLKLKVAGNPLIRKLEGYAPLSDADRATLARISAETRYVAPGTDLVREGDKPDSMFLVMEGLACRHKLRANGARQIMAYLVPGDACDLDVALLRAMDHTISTLSACRVVSFRAETVTDLLARHPQIAQALRMAQLVDAATLREWLMNIGRRSAVERLAHLFCELLVRLEAVGCATQDTYSLPVTQVDLADTTGLTAVHVNRTLQDLRRQGLIELRSSRMTVLDLPRLRAIAEFRPNYLHLGDRAAA
ncbi:helix-turn-helix domain-containing protein [Methylobacterium sp. GC_Met_2]|uniref:helix-turn-helix domain-containing protein n=1 Tax=Methylobacterium sp. GC_Met_2 TaxID=2937376 RepID=UPI00226B8FC6